MINNIALGVWAIIMVIASMSMFIFIHESVHVVRIEMPQMMCIGLSDEYVGIVTHNNFYSESFRFKEELIANVISSFIVLLFLYLTYYVASRINS